MNFCVTDSLKSLFVALLLANVLACGSLKKVESHAQADPQNLSRTPARYVAKSSYTYSRPNSVRNSYYPASNFYTTFFLTNTAYQNSINALLQQSAISQNASQLQTTRLLVKTSNGESKLIERFKVKCQLEEVESFKKLEDEDLFCYTPRYEGGGSLKMKVLTEHKLYRSCSGLYELHDENGHFLQNCQALIPSSGWF